MKELCKTWLLNLFHEILENIIRSARGLIRTSENTEVRKIIWFWLCPLHNMGSFEGEEQCKVDECEVHEGPGHTYLKQKKNHQQNQTLKELTKY